MKQFVQTIALNDVKCFARHGWYPEEQLTGTWFLVDVTVSFPFVSDETEDLAQTVNYEEINHIILNEMSTTRKMLETVVKQILHRLLAMYPFISGAEVTIRKMHPPMPGDIGHSLVRLTYAS